MYKHLFGPVASRRLGRSLGVDIVPPKTCSYNCTYCEVGRTTAHTARLSPCVPVGEILAEVRRKLKERPLPDVITVTGSGEPTLHAGLGRIIRGLKKMTDIPVAVLTNGSLLWKKSVRRALLPADRVLPSLDAWDEESFKKVNRPVRGLPFDLVLRGLRDFCREYPGQIWLEILLTANCLPDRAGLGRLKAIVDGLRVDKIQLNTVDRPPAVSGTRPVPRRTLERMAKYLGKKAEVIAHFSLPAAAVRAPLAEDAVRTLLARRPGTAADVAAGLAATINEARRVLLALVKQGRVKTVRRGRGVFYELLPLP